VTEIAVNFKVSCVKIVQMNEKLINTAIMRWLGICVLFAVMTMACADEKTGGVMSDKSIVRMAKGAGRWFPGDKQELSSMVSSEISAAKGTNISGRIIAGIAPHAGYQYSGKVAGYTYRALKDNFASNGMPEVIVVLGFSHRAGFGGVALMDGDQLETPLGRVKLDRETGDLLIKASSRIRYDYVPHNGEHSAENQIPFLQAAVPGVPLVVGLMGDHDGQTISELASALKDLAAKKKICVIASTDMLHDADYALVTKTDKETLKLIENLDHKALAKGWGYGRQTCCGIAPVLTVMMLAELSGVKKAEVLYYRNSGDDYPESRGSWVVGYGAVVFAKN
jgi:MEMO1 family protein